jgi:hypothetical protein
LRAWRQHKWGRGDRVANLPLRFGHDRHDARGRFHRRCALRVGVCVCVNIWGSGISSGGAERMGASDKGAAIGGITDRSGRNERGIVPSGPPGGLIGLTAVDPGEKDGASCSLPEPSPRRRQAPWCWQGAVAVPDVTGTCVPTARPRSNEGTAAPPSPGTKMPSGRPAKRGSTLISGSPPRARSRNACIAPFRQIRAPGIIILSGEPVSLPGNMPGGKASRDGGVRPSAICAIGPACPG